MADAITVNNMLVSFVAVDGDSIALLDEYDQVMAILPEEADSVVIHMAIRGNKDENMYYDFDLDQQFLGVSKFEGF